jgi:peptide deformylase
MKIIYYGDPILRETAKEVTEVTDEIRTILDEMVEIMREENGVGLAANQVGLTQRFFVGEVEGTVKKIINPEITEFGKEEIELEEGCLSIPGIYKRVKRPEKIKVKYLNEKGETVEEELDGVWARVFQHELDHLNGVLFIDKLSPLNKRLISKRLAQIKKEGN